jgi:hypothetical protein
MSIVAELELIKLKLRQAQPVEAMVDEDTLTIELSDGRPLSVPLVWFPRLLYGTPHERSHIEYFADTLYRPLLDEHIGVETLLLGPSLIPENERSLMQWKAALNQRRTTLEPA